MQMKSWLGIAAAVACVPLTAVGATHPAASAAPRVDAAKLPRIASVDPRFQSYNVEMAEVIGGNFWKPYTPQSIAAMTSKAGAVASGGVVGQDPTMFQKRAPIDLANPRLRKLAAALGPAYVRVSGTWANSAYFADTATPPSTAPKGFDGVLTRTDWSHVLDFARAADAKLVTSFTISAGVRDSAGVWTPVGARKLLDYTRSIGGHIAAAEFFNEPDMPVYGGAPKGYSAADYARDFAVFRKFAKATVPDMQVVGPGSVGEGVLMPLMGGAGMADGLVSTADMLAAQPPPKFDVFSYHFYGAASIRCTAMGAGGYNPVSEPNGRATQPWEGRPICAGNNTCNPVCPIGAKYDGSRSIDKAERLGAKVLENSVVYKIEHDGTGKITAIRYKKPDGSEHRLTARYFVLAAYAIETPKLLLLSASDKYPNGLANSSDQVGRNLMDHTGISVTMIAGEDIWPGQGPTELLVYLNHRDGPFRKDIPSNKIKLRNTVPTSQITSTLLEQGVFGSKLDAEIKRHSARELNWATDFETLPLSENRVTLSKTRVDGLGLPVPSLSYNVTDYWNAGRDFVLGKDMQDFSRLLNAQIVATDVGHQNRQHVMGTTIMGNDPKNSVVDSDCRTHDHANLFIAGTPVMPSVSCMNPTLTGAALSIRLADTLLKEI